MADQKTPWWAMLVLGVLIGAVIFGAGVGVYMTQHHEIALYGGEHVQFELVGCKEAEGVSCEVVNTSEWSEVFGVPTFLWAVPTYLGIAGLAGLAMWRRRWAWGILPLGLVASAFSAWLWYVSVVELGNVCLWCMRLYVLNFSIPALAGIALLPLGGAKARLPDKKVFGGSVGLLAGLAVVSVIAQQAYRQTLLGDAPAPAASVTLKPAGDPLLFVDPDGDLEPRTYQVTNEKKAKATLTLRATDQWKGNPDADVVVVEFADLECGYCKRAAGEMNKVYRAYGDRVLFVFKHYPMHNQCNPGVRGTKHRYACGAAVAAECAGEQGKFWAYHDLGFKNQHQLKPASLALYADKLGLDMAAWTTCVRDPQTLKRVSNNGADGKDLSVGGTPRIFINDKLFRAGSSAQQLARAIELELGTQGKQAAANAAALAAQPSSVQPIPADVPEMTRVQYGEVQFDIDTFESGVQDGGAMTGKHVIPATRMSWFAAKDACESAGKRMCTEREWVSVCQGASAVDDDGDGLVADDLIEGTTYPYGDIHDPRRCWSSRNPKTDRPVYTGEMPGCLSKDGVFDLAGNVEEWVGATPEQAVLLGGAFDTPRDKARCYRRNDTFGAGYANPRTGFRCCRDATDASTGTDAPTGTPVDTDAP